MKYIHLLEVNKQHFVESLENQILYLLSNVKPNVSACIGKLKAVQCKAQLFGLIVNDKPFF